MTALGSTFNAKGCFTQDKFLAGRSLRDIEKNIGFREGRLAQGAIVIALTRLPRKGEFRVAGYTNVSLNKFAMPGGLDPAVLERNAMQQWELTGRNRLVKVLPTIRHDPNMLPEIQYPHARGIPQWDLLVDLPCVVTAALSGYPNAIYRP